MPEESTFRIALNEPKAEAAINTVPPPDADANFDLVVLEARTVQLFRTGGSAVRLTLSQSPLGPERSFLRVQIARAFPFSNPDRFIGLRDSNDKDIGMLETLNGLDAASRAIVDEELMRRYFVPVVRRVVSVREERGGLTTWEVETDKGPHTFLVNNLRDALNELTPTRVLITDIEGTRWEFPDIGQLDEKSTTVLQRVM